MSPQNRHGYIHVFLGTKAQYNKTAPLLRLMETEGVPYRLIDSGQHGALSRAMRSDLGVREPDLLLGRETDVNTIPQAVIWSLRLATRLVSGRRIRQQVFGGLDGVVVIHGDTPSTFIAALMAKRAGLPVAHLEAGLTSGSWRNPFPEELIRTVVHRLANVLFAPSAVAAAYLARKHVRGTVVELEGNTSHEALAWAARDIVHGGGPVLVTMHRVENLYSRARVKLFVETVMGLAPNHPVRFVVHGPTKAVLERHGDLERLRGAGVELSSLLNHHEFVAAVFAAPFVITDGGSIQEECAIVGVPTLLWRERTERDDGVGANVVLGRFDAKVIRDFLANPAKYRRPFVLPATSPSRQVLKTLLAIAGARRS
jgi:UDP-N-acetylglucosamine 2-epimerase